MLEPRGHRRIHAHSTVVSLRHAGYETAAVTRGNVGTRRQEPVGTRSHVAAVLDAILRACYSLRADVAETASRVFEGVPDPWVRSLLRRGWGFRSAR